MYEHNSYYLQPVDLMVKVGKFHHRFSYDGSKWGKCGANALGQDKYRVRYGKKQRIVIKARIR